MTSSSLVPLLVPVRFLKLEDREIHIRGTRGVRVRGDVWGTRGVRGTGIRIRGTRVGIYLGFEGMNISGGTRVFGVRGYPGYEVIRGYEYFRCMNISGVRGIFGVRGYEYIHAYIH